MNIPPPSDHEMSRPSMSPGSSEPVFDPVFDDARTPKRIPLGRIVLAVVALAFVAHWCWPDFAIRHAEGVLVDAEPNQGPPATETVWSYNGYTFTSLARIDMEARVLHKKRYRFGREADVSKFDLALGWGGMSDQWVLDQLSFSQSGRWYFFKSDGLPPMSPSLMLNNSGNFHTVAENPALLDTIKRLRPGHVIHLQGELVRINASDGWHWESSLSRTDRGNGSCELIWIDAIEILNSDD